MNKEEILAILNELDLSMNAEAKEEYIDIIHEKIQGWIAKVGQIRSLLTNEEDDDEEETDIDFQQARKVADNIINYLSKNFKGFKLIDLMVRCEKKDIPDYQIILNPSINNYIEADDQILTQIVQTYDENLIVRNNIIIHVVKKRAEDISEQERILGINQIKQTNKNYAEVISQALDKLK